MNVPFILKPSGNIRRVEGNAIVKVANDKASVRKAAERFLGKSEVEIKSHIETVIVGYLKQQLQVESADDFQQRVYSLVVDDLSKMGLQVDSLIIY